MLEEADARVFVPMHGFTESFNLSVAAGLVLDRVMAILPASARGDLDPEEKRQLRREWYAQLSRNASTPAMQAQYEPYLAAAERGEAPAVLPDLRKAKQDKGLSIRPNDM